MENSRLNVLVLMDAPYAGGTATHAVMLCEALNQMDCGAHPILATLPPKRDDNALFALAAQRRCEVNALPMPGWRSFPCDLRQIKEFLRVREIGLIHVHEYRAAVWSRLFARHIPVVATFHGPLVDPTMKLRAYQEVKLALMRRMPMAAACSSYVREWLLRRGFVQEQVMVIANGYAPPPGGDAIVPAYPPKPGCPTLLYAGRLVPGKGLRFLMEAMAGMNGLRLLVAGDGPLLNELRDKARTHGVDAVFLGARADMPSLYASADWVVLPSRQEALPMTLIEAAAYGRPAIASNVGGIPEVVLSNQTGLLLPPGDIRAWRDALASLTSLPAKSWGDAARVRWKDHFTATHMARDYATLYARVAR